MLLLLAEYLFFNCCARVQILQMKANLEESLFNVLKVVKII